MSIWYQEDFNSAPSGNIVGYDGWEAWWASSLYDENHDIEMLNISSTYLVDTGQSLACEVKYKPGTIYQPMNITKNIRKKLDTRSDYSVQFQYEIFQAGTANHQFVLRMTGGSQSSELLSGLSGGAYTIASAGGYWTPWGFKVDGLGRVSAMYSGSGAPPTPILQMVIGQPYKFKITMSLDSVVKFYGCPATGSFGDPLFIATVRSVMPNVDIDMTSANSLWITSYVIGRNNDGVMTKAALDDILLEGIPQPVPPVPLAPANIMVNMRQNYAILSWDKVTCGYVNETISRAASGYYTDFTTNTDLATSPNITSAVIGGQTIFDTVNLPKEGADFTVNRFAGSITWIPSSAKKPDFSTDYVVHYEVPINNVTGYTIYKSDLLNEYTRALYNVVTGVDFSGAVDTAFVDTNVAGVQVYRVASTNSNMVESELSEKAVAIRTSSQIDEKTELIDRKLFTLDQSLLDEGILR